MNRTDILQYIIDKYNLQSYCELGTQVRSINFDKIICEDKFCVDIDPNTNADFIGSTDDFFKQLNRNYDLYFIDASHIAEDVKRDFENCLRYCNNNSFIVLHDCNPEKEEHTIVPRPKPTGHWNGDVYKFAASLIGQITVDIDNGCTIWKAGTEYKRRKRKIDWEYFDKNRKEILNLISFDEFVKL
jgi:hypothetical protein